MNNEYNKQFTKQCNFFHIFRHIKNKLLQIVRSSFIVSVSCSINFKIIIIYSINFNYFCVSFVCSIHSDGDPALKVCKSSWFNAPRKHNVYLMLFHCLRRLSSINPSLGQHLMFYFDCTKRN